MTKKSAPVCELLGIALFNLVLAPGCRQLNQSVKSYIHDATNHNQDPVCVQTQHGTTCYSIRTQ